MTTTAKRETLRFAVSVGTGKACARPINDLHKLEWARFIIRWIPGAPFLPRHPFIPISHPSIHPSMAAAVILPRSSAIVLPLVVVTTAPKVLLNTPCRSIINSRLRRRRRFERISCRRSCQRWRVHASVAEEALPDPESVIENAKQAVQSGNDDISSTIVSTLLFIAFVGLTLLTIGVIYLGVTDFLQKRERDKFEKEEAAKKKKKNGKKGKVKTRAGPRGFGQKLEEEEEDQDI
ncbi:hypothetical protein J5N97_030283 [Dioscorea zingiberensis]|uniref:Uncharacterized protein n=1 Tax=Dioscorea zingiberensis TaxID=325984 RepID=A0A9D5BXI4_9LILI|nr:hypothetical protein J5N97_030283 [Dioscorea zingiberensis]